MNDGIFFKNAFRFGFSDYKAVHAIPLALLEKPKNRPRSETGFNIKDVSRHCRIQ